MTLDPSAIDFIDGTELRVNHRDSPLVREALRIQDENPEGRSSRITVDENGLVCSVELRRLLSWAIKEDHSISHFSSVFIFDLINPSRTRVLFQRISNPDRNIEVFEMETTAEPLDRDVYQSDPAKIEASMSDRELSSSLQDSVEKLLNKQLNRYETIEVKGLLFRSNASVFRDMESIERSIKLTRKIQLGLELKFPNLSS